MQIVAEKSLWAGPTGEKKKTKNYFVALQIVAEKSLWAGPTGEKRKKIRACGLLGLSLLLVA
jgi:hypothetical protein